MPRNQDKSFYPLARHDRKTAVADILARYEAGETMQQIGESYGLTKSTQIYRLLIAENPELYREYQAAKTLHRLEAATEALEGAADGIGVARAREQIRAAQWELERVLRRLYGVESQAGSGSTVNIFVGIDRSAGTTKAEIELNHLQVPDSDT